MPAVSAASLRGIDAVLVSHAHYDDLDVPSLERLGRSVPVVLPRGLGRLLRRRRFESVTELDLGEDLSIGALTVRATPAEHHRGPFGVRATAVGFAVLGSARVNFAGDTDLFAGMTGLVEALDLALLPICGWGPSLGPGHLDPGRAAEAVRRLAPRTVVPMQWGTYPPMTSGLSRSPAFLGTPPTLFAAELMKTAPNVRLQVLQPGESFELSG